MALVAAPPTSANAKKKRNLLSYGRFEKWNDDNEPRGWHTHLTSIIPVPEYSDPENKKGRTGVVNFVCGCGYDWGAVRPWTNLVCPKCKHMNTGLEDSGAHYLDNHKYVSFTQGKQGKGVGIKMPDAVGNVQGVRVISELVEAERGAGYKISFDAKTKGPHLRVFVECFREIPGDKKARQWVASLPQTSNPMKLTKRLKRVYRKQINCNKPAEWTHFAETFAPPKRSQFDYMFVTLYAYLPGEAAYDNVVLCKLTRSELKLHKLENPGPKDKRLR